MFVVGANSIVRRFYLPAGCCPVSYGGPNWLGEVSKIPTEGFRLLTMASTVTLAVTQAFGGPSRSMTASRA